MKLFKYMENKWATELVNNGSLRINSLNYFKDHEAHGEAIGDAEENTLQVYTNPEYRDGNTLNEFEKQFVRIEGEGDKSGIVFNDCTFTQSHQGLPTYALCLSDTYCTDLQRRMSESNIAAGNSPYDACIEIDDHVEFVKLVSEAVFQKVGLEYYGHGHCFYKERRIPWETWNPRSQQCPAFIKPLGYSWQKEIRIIFKTASHNDLEPIDISIPAIKKLCRFI